MFRRTVLYNIIQRFCVTKVK